MTYFCTQTYAYSMTDLLTFSFGAFVSISTLTNPITNVPIFLGLLGDEDDETRKRIAKKACLIAFFILSSFVLLGTYIFSIFDITVPSFKITGGLLVFYVGFEMLLSKKSTIRSSGIEKPDDDVAISPLAIPFVAGPGAIVASMNSVSNADFFRVLIVVLIIALIMALNYYAFNFSRLIIKRLGKNIINVLGKIMGLIIAIIGTDMFIQGIKLSFHLE
ncbi:MarC family protein [Ornithobacterium rhinotracheale]|uniref:MarC family protein n=1 Tax=Ornithobacterium rhinotracheale TaxID=28251 RepID=UPI001FBB59D0|nr:MarC family protein [Ornithobacterium rhinotracheale]UOH77364.1 MarC family protein [Ornithobacterium rhinotracheale]